MMRWKFAYIFGGVEWGESYILVFCSGGLIDNVQIWKKSSDTTMAFENIKIFRDVKELKMIIPKKREIEMKSMRITIYFNKSGRISESVN